MNYQTKMAVLIAPWAAVLTAMLLSVAGVADDLSTGLYVYVLASNGLAGSMLFRGFLAAQRRPRDPAGD